MRPLLAALATCCTLLAASGTSLGQEGPEGTEILPATEESAHLPPGVVEYDYGTPFPTSGVHAAVPTDPGFFSVPQPLSQLVHALEHGNIVIYYDAPGEEVVSRLLGLANEHVGEPHGIVVVPSAGIGEQIALTAWERRLILPRYEEDQARAFIAAFLGRVGH
ncbi:MAG TPA: DUF3105 domain-containing protein [Methylomirabilota bacterium]|jgi:hypothetical protein|nr:DUF3105 domain-containing protein [Methylomirabilota bacterium]